MTIYLCSELIETLQQQTEQHIQLAISQWQNKSAAPFNIHPQPGSWSAAQCLEHLNIYGRYYLPAIENAISRVNKLQSKRSNIFKSGWLGNYFTNLMKPAANGSLKKKDESSRECQAPSSIKYNGRHSRIYRSAGKIITVVGESEKR